MVAVADELAGAFRRRAALAGGAEWSA